MLVPCILLFALHCEPLHVMDTSPVELCAYLDKSCALAGQPVNLVFGYRSDRKARLSIVNDGPYTTGLFRLILSREGEYDLNKSAQRQLCVRPIRQGDIVAFDLCTSEWETVTFPLHLRYTTDLPPGEYEVRIQAINGSVWYEGKNKKLDLEGEIQVGTLEITRGGAGELESIFDNLLQEAVQAYEADLASKGSSLSTDFALPSTIKSLLWGYGSIAATYQIQFLFSNPKIKLWPSVTIHAFQNIILHACQEDVQRLVTIVDSKKPSAKLGYSNSLREMLIWAMYRLYEVRKGDDEIRRIIEPVIDVYSTEFDPAALETPPG